MNNLDKNINAKQTTNKHEIHHNRIPRLIRLLRQVPYPLLSAIPHTFGRHSEICWSLSPACHNSQWIPSPKNVVRSIRSWYWSVIQLLRKELLMSNRIRASSVICYTMQLREGVRCRRWELSWRRRRLQMYGEQELGMISLFCGRWRWSNTVS